MKTMSLRDLRIWSGGTLTLGDSDWNGWCSFCLVSKPRRKTIHNKKYVEVKIQTSYRGGEIESHPETEHVYEELTMRVGGFRFYFRDAFFILREELDNGQRIYTLRAEYASYYKQTPTYLLLPEYSMIVLDETTDKTAVYDMKNLRVLESSEDNVS